MAAVLCSFGMPTSDVQAVMRTYANSGTLSYQRFLEDMKPLWEYMFSELKADDDDVPPGHNFGVATGTFARLSTAYLAHVSSQGDQTAAATSTGKFAPSDSGRGDEPAASKST